MEKKKAKRFNALPTGGIRESLTFLSIPNENYFKHAHSIFIIRSSLRCMKGVKG